MNFTKIHPMGVELMHADWGTDRHDIANNCFLWHNQMCLKSPVSVSMQICRVGIHLFMRTDRQTDVMKLMVTFHDYFVYTPKKKRMLNMVTCAFLSVLFLVTLWINMNVFCIFWFQIVVFELFTAGTQIVFTDRPILGPVFAEWYMSAIENVYQDMSTGWHLTNVCIFDMGFQVSTVIVVQMMFLFGFYTMN